MPRAQEKAQRPRPSATHMGHVPSRRRGGAYGVFAKTKHRLPVHTGHPDGPICDLWRVAPALTPGRIAEHGRDRCVSRKREIGRYAIVPDPGWRERGPRARRVAVVWGASCQPKQRHTMTRPREDRTWPRNEDKSAAGKPGAGRSAGERWFNLSRSRWSSSTQVPIWFSRSPGRWSFSNRPRVVAV